MLSLNLLVFAEQRVIVNQYFVISEFLFRKGQIFVINIKAKSR